jgi:hypothetical protein
MKTGGASFRRWVEANLGAEHVYPNPEVDRDLLTANLSVTYLTGLPRDRVARIQAYTGHFPFAATQMLPGPLVTLTVLRDPVERTVSYLKHCRTYQAQHRGLPLEEIYEDPWYFPTMILNHQAKVFAFSPDDRPEQVGDVLDIDDARLAQAKANLTSVDVIGLHHRYDEFLAEVGARFGWPVETSRARWHVSEDVDVSSSLRRRITDDLGPDIEFYEHARALHRNRTRTA